MTEMTHKFTMSGLGDAPFTFLSVTENVFVVPGEVGRAGGTCDHCGTCIRWEFNIRSVDGVKSKVGSDCIHKAGDAGLINKAKAEKNRRAREARHAKREAARVAKLDAERAANGGLTNHEVRVANEKVAAAARAEARKPLIAALAPIAERLDDNRGGFREGVAADLRRGKLPFPRGIAIVAEILGKEMGRMGSNDFKAEEARVLAIFDKVEADLGG